MSYRSILTFFLLISCTPLFTQNDLHPLEQALSGIVTIGVFERNETDLALGFAEEEEGKNYAEIAYEQQLQLGDVVSTGSGFVIDIDGTYYIVTNAHVIDKAAQASGALKAFSIQRNEYPVKVFGGDTFYDLAVLEFDGVDPGPEIQPLTFSEREVQLVEKVYAIGNPLGKYPYSITEGIISGKNRLDHRPATGRFGYLQHTASLIWGNSGGPLVNEQGDVVGVNTRIEINEKGGQSYIISQLNFALEGLRARRLVNSIIENEGRVQRPFLGVEFAVTTNSYIPGPDSQPYIKSVLPDSPAAETLGNKTGFKVNGINGLPVRTLQDIVRIIEDVAPGDPIDLQLQGPMSRPKASVTSGELSSERLEEIARYFFGTYVDGYTIETDEAGVVLKGTKEDVKLEQFQEAGQGSLPATYQRIDGKPQYGLGGMGHMSFQGQLGLYRTATLEDLGAIIRLCTLEGNLGATLVEGSEYAGTFLFALQDEDFNELKVLYY